MERFENVVDKFIESIEAGDSEAFAALFAEDAVGHHPLYPEPVRGREAIRQSEQALFDAFSDISVDVRSVLVDGDRSALEVVIEAVNTGPLDLGEGEPVPATGRTVALPASWWLDLGPDDLIVETRDYLDTATFLRQLGLEAT
ncbi:ester cyclase [Egicoccus sp. AB-alg6-2]|uniref:ester cyclase n=1 Tax=Egicoccus sp. AB-alg6-2 TaxID=3242692 RepID=UPI00359E754D